MKTNKKGFTLVELIVVVAVLAIVSIVAVPTASAAMESMDKRACQTSLDSLKSYWVMNKKMTGTESCSLNDFILAYDDYTNTGSSADPTIQNIIDSYGDEFAGIAKCKHWQAGTNCYEIDGSTNIKCTACGATTKTDSSVS